MDLPANNATLNVTSCILLILGLGFVKAGRKRAHATTMISATAVSSIFLACYLTYHFKVVPEVGHTTFNRGGALKVAYYMMLASHVLLAAVNLPMILATLWKAYRRDWAGHRRLARWTFPIWLYVSITGVLVYFALYRWNLPPDA